MAALAESPLYERLAHDLGASIAKGQLRAGDRLPSVRRLARERSVSVATVLQAYFELENEGLVEVRPKSGHFVRRERAPELLEPSTPRRSSVPSEITVSAAVAALVASVRDPSVVALGSAVMAAELLPIGKLNRILSEIAREMSTAGAGYDPAPGLSTLRRQLARRAVLIGMPLREDDFITTVGAMEALHIALRAVVRPGDTIAIESPSYFGVLQLIEEMGIRALEIPMHPRTGMDLEALEVAMKRGGIKAVVAIPTVSNPLGSVMPDDSKRQLMSLLERFDVPLIEDDVYGDTLFDGSRPAPVKALDRDGRVLYVGSVSKTLAPGYRVGWLSAGRYQAVAERLKFTQSVATPTLPQMAVAEFLASGGYDRHLRKTRRLLSGQIDRTREAIARHFPAGTRVSAPRGGFVVWVELPGKVSSFAIQRAALERGISVAPGPIFSAGGRFENHLRLSAGVVWSERIEQALETLAEIVKDSERLRSIPCFQVDAFTDQPLSGNPAAVCPLEEWLPDELMQGIARENALSETAFFVRRGKRFELRWFTPEVEVELCGHATLASALIIFERLAPELKSIDFDSKSGKLKVRRLDEELVLDFPLQQIRPIEAPPGLLEALGVTPVALFQGRYPVAVLQSAEAVQSLRPNLSALAEVAGVSAVIVTAAGAPETQVDYVLRLFAPKNGIPEDPVTGSAQCALAPYWAEQLQKRSFRVRQLSRRGGEMGVTLTGSRVLISGRAVLVKTGELLLPDALTPS